MLKVYVMSKKTDTIQAVFVSSLSVIDKRIYSILGWKVVK